jgi:hypothetical protein
MDWWTGREGFTITPMKDFSKAMARLKTGEASKILIYPNATK